MKKINFRLNAPRWVFHADTGGGCGLLNAETGRQRATRSNSASKKSGKKRFASALLFLILLFVGLPQSSRAGDVNPSNVFGSVTDVSVKYESGRGYYITLEFLVLANSGIDGDYMDLGRFYVGGKKAFELDNVWDDDEAEDMKMSISTYNGFAARATPAMWHSDDYESGIVKSGNKANVRGSTTASGNVWIRVKLYLPQDIIAAGNTAMFLELWDEDNNEKGSRCTVPATYGTLNFNNLLPAISGTPSVALYSSWEHYRLSYTISKGLADEATATLTGSSYSNLTGTLAANTTNGTIVTPNGNYALLSSYVSNHQANLEIKWDYPATGISYTTTQTGININHIRYPQAIETINKNNGTVQIKWTTDALTSNYSSDGWRLQYQIGGTSGAWKDIPGTIPAVDNSKDSYETTFTIPEAERKQGNKNYYFRVSRKCVANDVRHKETMLAINTDYKQLAKYSMADGTNKFPLIKWELTSSGIYSPDNVSLKLRIGTTDTDITESLSGGEFQTSANEGVSECLPQRYQLILKNGNDAAITYTLNESFVYMPAGKREYESATVSKGYYPDKINIKWTLRKDYDEFTRFRIMRKQLDEPDTEWVSISGDIIHTRNTLSYNYDDANINAGIYYQYKIDGIYQCVDKVGSLFSSEQVGFSQPFGSVSGRITYAGSSAVQDVTVNIATDDALRNNRELSFLGGSKSYINVPAKTKLLNPAGFSVQFWLKKNGDTAHTLLTNNAVTIKLNAASNPFITIGDKTLTADTVSIRKDAYQHLSITATKSGSSYNVNIFVNGSLKKSGTLTPSSAITNSTLIKVGSAYNGYMDDIRFWNKALSASEVQFNYDRILSGKESGLAAYYKCDETDKINSDLFDCSADGTQFNANHATKGIDATRVDVPITANHLTIKGVTDKNGIYTITNAIPFTSEGTTYTIEPTYGSHKFDPSQRPLFFSPDSKVFNSVDFTDVSSFPVSGVVTYNNSNYPVEGVQILVDGLPASKDGQMLVTDAQGNFTVDVPIGAHFISISKQGHIFANGGRFPKDNNGLGLKHNFQTSLSGLEFKDMTTVRLIGRVAGGQPETDKQLGFGLSKANIGQATVTLKTVNNVYRLNLATQDSVNTATIGGKPSTTRFVGSGKGVVAGSTIEIETNAETGEFIAILPPVPYNLIGAMTKDFRNDNGTASEYEFSYSNMLFNINPSNEVIAKHKDISGSQSTFVYNDSVKITRYNAPTIDVVDKTCRNAPYGAFGDSVYVYYNTALNKSDTIQLYKTLPTGGVSYTFGYPVFSQKRSLYAWEVSAQEEYLNHDDPANPTTDIVPLGGNIVQINNGLASGYTEFNAASGGEQVTLTSSKSEITLNDKGKKTFSFNAGFPKFGGDHLLAVKLTMSQNGKDIIWNNRQASGAEFKAYLLGMVPTDGNNFVTIGPDQIDIVLPDPPGSYSYSFIEKGSTVTTTHEKSFAFETSEVGNITAHLGLGVRALAGGPGLMVESKWETILDLEGSIGGKQTRKEGNRTETTLTFNERISTSGDMNFVGADADVYIGKSTNRIFGQVRNLSFYPKAEDNTGSKLTTPDNKYALFPKEITSVGDEFSTMFSYTQGYLVNVQIPNMKKLRNDMIRHWEGEYPTNASGLSFVDDKGKEINAIYLSKLDVNNPDFGKQKSGGKEYYKVYYNPALTKGKDMVDEVAAYNNWIANWEKAISNNEEAKIGMFDKRADLESKKMMYNRSFNAGVNLAESTTAEYSNMELRDSTNVFLGSFTEKFGIIFNDQLGGEESFTVGRENTWEDNWEEGNASSISFGYELSEDGGDYLKGVNDALTVDIYKPVEGEMKAVIDKGKQNSPVKTLRGYTFRTRAGQTSCPYEPADSTIYYTKDGKAQLLNYGTFQIEKPQIFINNSKNATAENIPTGREATFEVKMNNMSDTKDDVTYQLAVGDYSNLNGLILSIDGTPLTVPRDYTIEYGKELVKTLKVRQGSLDILNYSDIQLVLSSSCDDNELTSDAANLNVKFTPSSSPITLRAGSTLANRADLNNGGEIEFTISDYERSFKNFGLIRLQYRNSTEETWNTFKEFVNDENLFPITGDREKIKDYTIKYKYKYSEITPADGKYIFRALSVSKIGNKEVVSSSSEITITKDVRTPQVLGFPSPISGILNTGDEISITFNEDIQPGLITADKFSITGVLNGDMRMEPSSGLTFDGNANKAFTEQTLSGAESFAIESWIQLPQLKAGTLFAWGENDNYISMGLDASGRVKVSIGSETHTSTAALEASEAWKYIGVSYDHKNKSVSVYALEGSKNLELIRNQKFAQIPPTYGRLYVGNNKQGDSGFKGAVSQVHFYNTARTIGNASASKYTVKTGREPGLIGLWELEEGEGATAKDKARSRALTLNTAWYVYPAGKSIAFSGNKNDYATISSGLFPFRTYDDFTWEFWFKGNSQGAATLLSAGTAAHIGFNDKHELILSTDSSSQVLDSLNRLDDQWHHLALSVKRGGNSNAYVNGKKTATFDSNIFPNSVSGAYYTLGAKKEKLLNASNNVIDSISGGYFKGNMDEVRVWSSALNSSSIQLDRNRKLRGTEAGLQAYYPFERYKKEDQITQVYPSMEDMVTLNDDVTGNTLILGIKTATSDIAASMQDARPVKNVPFTVTASDRKVVLNITEEPYRIENVTLTVTAKDIIDMHNNPSSAYKWIAYVDQNPLNWETEPVNLTIEEGVGATIKAKLSNRSGAVADYAIEDIPQWMTVNAPLGTIQPQASKELTFTISKWINIGSYEASIALVGTNNIRKILPIQLKVTGQRPDWTVNPHDYEFNMNVVGVAQIEGVPQEDDDDMMGAFINDVCVGIAQPVYSSEYNAYHLFMTVYGNSTENGKDVKFKFWDAGTGRIYPQVVSTQSGVPTNVVFAGQTTKYAQIKNPVILNAHNVIEQQIKLNKGWNWISANVTSSSPNLLEQFKEELKDNGIQIKSQVSSLEFLTDSAFWDGNLDNISVADAYLLNVNKAQTLHFTGVPAVVAATPITLKNGWNWIGYTPQFTSSTSEALSGINSYANDQITGQKGFEVYNNGWIGSLGSMQSGKGYMYFSENPDAISFTYPSATTSMGRSAVVRTGNDTETNGTPLHWDNGFRRFANNMTITVIVTHNGQEQRNTDLEIAAFINGDCRGNTRLVYNPAMPIHQHLGYMMVYGDESQDLTFKVYDHKTGTEYSTLNYDVRFEVNGRRGNGLSPYVIKMDTPTLIADTWGTSLHIYPNPVVDKLNIKRRFEVIDLLEITDLSGRLVFKQSNFKDASIDVSAFAEGMYLLRITHENRTRTMKFTKK